MVRFFILLTVMFTGMAFVSGQAYAVDATVDKVLAQWDTFKDSPHLDKDYRLAKILTYKDKKGYALKYATPEGENKRYYRYLFTDTEGLFLYEISLGSYDATTKIDREMGHIGPNDRLYHLDMYCPGPKSSEGVSQWGGHHTLGFYEQLPDFDEMTRAIEDQEKDKVRCKGHKPEGLSATFKNPNKK